MRNFSHGTVLVLWAVVGTKPEKHRRLGASASEDTWTDDPCGNGQRGRTEKVHVHITRLLEKVVLEVVELEVFKGMTHVRFFGKELAFEDDFVSTMNPAEPSDALGQAADPQFRSARRPPQLGMG